MNPSFVHLRLHTDYSLVDGTVRIPELMETLKARGMPAVALTDQSNLFAMVKFYSAAIAAGVKPIIGCDVLLRGEAQGEPATPLTLLVQNDAGYGNLIRLVSRSYLEGQRDGEPTIERQWLDGATDGLIALSGGRTGEVARNWLAGRRERTLESLADWMARFPGRFYLEIHRTGREHEEAWIDGALELASTMECPVVATNDVRYLEADHFDAHEARVCIHDSRVLADPRRPKRYSGQQYLRTEEEMVELFSDIPEALENSVEIARRCNLKITLGESYLPDFPVPAEHTADSYLREVAFEGLDQRLHQLYGERKANDEEFRKPYVERLERELGVINSMGFPGYFLIVADFIAWAKNNGVPVGPGRGSGAGSLVAYAQGITDLDPLRYDLLFERFLNPERVSLPDFDVDFCMDGRDRVIDYVAQKYGSDKVSQIITYGSMAARAVIRDVGRVLGHPYGMVDRIAKLVPFEVGMTLDRALKESEDLKQVYDDEEDVHALLDLGMKLEGLARNAGKHAGGVVIAPSALTDFAPLYCEPGGQGLVTQFDKDDVEKIGLVKFDFLGLRTLTIIDRAVNAINERLRGEGRDPISMDQLETGDPAAFKLLKACQTTAVFQLESRGMKELIKRLQPDNFEEIVALVALFRPGPLQSGMVDDFIARKHGHAEVQFPHPWLEAILKPTYGVILYQEQVMQIAQVLAGYSLGAADLLRRAMGKKKPEEMAKQRSGFVEGATAQGVEQATAEYIFDLIEKFAGYGFNKSHSAAYALLSYQTAWLKAHYPAEFMAAVLSADMDNTDKVVTLIDECASIGLDVIPPDINNSAFSFTAVDAGRVRFGLGAIKGVGESALEAILRERDRGGAFADLDDLCVRVDAGKVNRRVLEALNRAGTLGGLGPNRATIEKRLPHAVRAAEQHRANAATGQNDMFGGGDKPAVGSTDIPPEPDWDDETRLTAEKETLGLYLSGHPIDRYSDELARFTNGRLADQCGKLESLGRRRGEDRNEVFAGLVNAFRTKNTSTGKMGFATIDDKSTRVEVKIGPELLQRRHNSIVRDRVLVVEGQLAYDDFNGGYQINAREIYSIDDARERFARRLRLHVNGSAAGNGFIDHLRDTLRPFREGHTPIAVEYQGPSASARLNLGEDWQIHPTDELLHRLRQLTDEGAVEIEYQR
ncbi:MAG: DNA polymerase III subunit alpha [Halofilum sp. (in: g-proteobacteria)]|nr:DNA polymerase III subunit alpha [Halofilum sp. (in: g-proteobacteria)]